MVRIMRASFSRWIGVVAGHEVDTDIPLLAASYEHERAIITTTEVRALAGGFRASE